MKKEIISSHWFGNIGIVIFKDSQGKERASIGTILGTTEKEDEQIIAQTGQKFPLEAAKLL